MKIIPVPAFEDNYIWLICDDQHAVAVDPGDAEPVLNYLKQHGLQLTAILITHHHGDHTGGVKTLLRHASVPVYGPRHENIPGITHPVGEGDTVHLPELDVEYTVFDVPGHTAGHVAYYGANSLFCGDTLFTCGCGKLFEGTPAQMYNSLQKFAALPDTTLVYCTHEYTLENIRFAKKVEPANRQLLEREVRDIQTRQQDLPTLPSTMALEKATNPFLRCDHPDVISAARHFSGNPLDSPVQVFAAVREWRNRN